MAALEKDHPFLSFPILGKHPNLKNKRIFKSGPLEERLDRNRFYLWEPLYFDRGRFLLHLGQVISDLHLEPMLWCGTERFGHPDRHFWRHGGTLVDHP